MNDYCGFFKLAPGRENVLPGLCLYDLVYQLLLSKWSNSVVSLRKVSRD